MESSNNKKQPQIVCQQDQGTSSKKKKDRENRLKILSGEDFPCIPNVASGNSISNDLIFEWNQKNEFVFVTLQVGHNNDNKSVTITSEEHKLIVAHTDGRKFSTRLFEAIVPECTAISYKGPRCIIKLLKMDPNIDWLQLEPCKKSTPERTTPKGKSPSPAPKDKSIIPEIIEEKIFNLETICVRSLKIELVERDLDPVMSLYLYVKSINKDNVEVLFTEDTVKVKFSTSDSKYLALHPHSTAETIFEWSTNLKDKIIPNDSKFKVSQHNIEIKIKKVCPRKCGVISVLGNDSGNKVSKNTWIAAKSPENLNDGPPDTPAPPAPPESKKPMCLVSPLSKGMRGGPSLSLADGPCNREGLVVPRGMTGLDNIGNTCFMNSVLQCLVNTRELREYFLDNAFQQDLNKENPLGTGGKLAISFAILMKLVWSGSYRSHAPSKLKSIMSVKANQFSGFAQHDSQEFMIELLDGLHEDLNHVKKKPYIAEPPDLDGWEDHEAAAESWRLHRLRNESVIDDLIKGQFKSTLTCHECNKVSVKFDEFSCLSVPIPKDQKVIEVIFFWKDPLQKPKKFFIRVCADALVDELKKELSERTGISSHSILVLEMFKNKIHKILVKGTALSAVVPNDALMAFEIYSEKQINERIIEVAVIQRMLIPNPPARCSSCSRNATPSSKLRRCTKCYRAGYCDQACQKSHWLTHKATCKLIPEPVGCPFVVSLPESHATYSRLARIMEAYARYSVDIFQPPVVYGESSNRRGSTSSLEHSSDSNDDMEVESTGIMESTVHSNDVTMDGDSFKEGVDLEGTKDLVERYNNEEEGATGGGEGNASDGGGGSGSEEPPQLSSSPSIRAVQPRGSLQLRTNATQLFSIRPVTCRAANIPGLGGEKLADKGEEPLDLSDKYYLAMDWRTNERLPIHCLVQNKEVDCETEGGSTHVQHNQQTSLQACIELFTQPENLSENDCWRCPRCKKPVEATKQMSVWRLPPVLIIQLKRFSFKYVMYSDKIDKYVHYPVRDLDLGPYMSALPKDGPAIYDLYGVINHMGRLLGGHYTAYARTVDAQDSRESEIDWRLCDDSRVNMVPESKVVNEQAYLLLYRRRDTPFVVSRPLPSVAMEATSLETESQEDAVEDHVVEADEVTPMSISSTSQPSLSSLEGEEHVCTAQEELD